MPFCSKHQVRHRVDGKYKSCVVKEMLNTKSAIEQELIYEEGIKVGLIMASELFPKSTPEILLAAGEMTAQELRTVNAVLKWIKSKIEKAAT